MPEISPQELSRRLEGNADDLLVVDIRNLTGFEQWHIPGSENIPVYEELKADPSAAADALNALPSDREIVTVCAAGVVSQTATELLRERGYDARTLVDGMRGWGRVHRQAEISTECARVVQVARPGTGCLSYLVAADGEAVVVDPSQYTDRYDEMLADENLALTAVVETHAHADHISGAAELADSHGVPYYLHPADSGTLADTTALEDGQIVPVGDTELEVIHTPGHTEGSVTFALDGGALFTGDTLFLDSVGRPDLEGGDDQAVESRAETLYDSVQRLLDESDGAYVFPAHDSGTPSPLATARLGEARQRNPLLTAYREAFVAAITEDIPETPPNHEQIKGANVGETTLDEDEARRLELGPNQCAAN
jgi:glyoxylase-like metal-dependent hydrolase (beta-lactamase superfamily II)/rhodanese-related sulfurtransferase